MCWEIYCWARCIRMLCWKRKRRRKNKKVENLWRTLSADCCYFAQKQFPHWFYNALSRGCRNKYEWGFFSSSTLFFFCWDDDDKRVKRERRGWRERNLNLIQFAQPHVCSWNPQGTIYLPSAVVSSKCSHSLSFFLLQSIHYTFFFAVYTSSDGWWRRKSFTLENPTDWPTKPI